MTKQEVWFGAYCAALGGVTKPIGGIPDGMPIAHVDRAIAGGARLNGEVCECAANEALDRFNRRFPRQASPDAPTVVELAAWRVGDRCGAVRLYRERLTIRPDIRDAVDALGRAAGMPMTSVPEETP